MLEMLQYGADIIFDADKNLDSINDLGEDINELIERGAQKAQQI